MALRIRCWKTAGLRILLITSFFGFTCGILIYFIKNRSVYDGAGGKGKFECINVTVFWKFRGAICTHFLNFSAFSSRGKR